VRQIGYNHLLLNVAHTLLRSLVVGVDHVVVLASELIIDQIDTWLTGLLGNLRVLELLTKSVGLGGERNICKRLRLSDTTSQVHPTKLLRSQVEKLLLELLLPLGEVHLGGQELSSKVGVDFAIIVLNLRGSQHLIRSSIEHLLLLLVVLAKLVVDGATKSGTDSGLWHALIEAIQALTRVARLIQAGAVLGLMVWSRGRGLGRRRSLGRGAETSKQMRAASAGRRSLNRVLSDGGNLGRRSNAEALGNPGPLSAGGKAGAREANAAVGLEVVVSHLSKTASVHCRWNFLSGALEGA
jgi:hypothetical protein